MFRIVLAATPLTFMKVIPIPALALIVAGLVPAFASRTLHESDMFGISAFAILTSVVGIPHGGLDHLYGKSICRPWAGRLWPLVFFGGYTLISVVMVVCWSLLPLFTVVCFFLLSAAHFGGEKLFPRGVLEGGMVIWIPFLARPREAVSLLTMISPGDLGLTPEKLVISARPLFMVLAIVLALRICGLSQGGDGRHDVRWIRRSALLAGFAAIFAATPVLFGFVVFFCGWHSIRELLALAHKINPRRLSRGLIGVYRLAAPMSILLIAITIIAGCWHYVDGDSLEKVVIQHGFISLSAVAVPHILLHKLADRLSVDPFAPGSVR